jgi:hypothetical protein
LKPKLVSARCKAINAEGYQCGRDAIPGREICWTHLAKVLVDEEVATQQRQKLQDRNRRFSK